MLIWVKKDLFSPKEVAAFRLISNKVSCCDCGAYAEKLSIVFGCTLYNISGIKETYSAYTYCQKCLSLGTYVYHKNSPVHEIRLDLNKYKI